MGRSIAHLYAFVPFHPYYVPVRSFLRGWFCAFLIGWTSCWFLLGKAYLFIDIQETLCGNHTTWAPWVGVPLITVSSSQASWFCRAGPTDREEGDLPRGIKPSVLLSSRRKVERYIAILAAFALSWMKVKLRSQQCLEFHLGRLWFPSRYDGFECYPPSFSLVTYW